jgi:hypothetical protein
MDHHQIITELSRNKEIFNALLFGKNRNEYLYKPATDKWCMVEVLCHLVDEEKEDFRTRVEYVLRNPLETLPTFDPTVWPETRNYLGQDFNKKLDEFLTERVKSTDWLKGLVEPKWKNANHHPEAGPRSAEYFLANWLAHDYIHIRQLNRLAFEYLQKDSNNVLSYAGNW